MHEVASRDVGGVLGLPVSDERPQPRVRAQHVVGDEWTRQHRSQPLEDPRDVSIWCEGYVGDRAGGRLVGDAGDDWTIQGREGKDVASPLTGHRSREGGARLPQGARAQEDMGAAGGGDVHRWVELAGPDACGDDDTARVDIDGLAGRRHDPCAMTRDRCGGRPGDDPGTEARCGARHGDDKSRVIDELAIPVHGGPDELRGVQCRHELQCLAA